MTCEVGNIYYNKDEQRIYVVTKIEKDDAVIIIHMIEQDGTTHKYGIPSVLINNKDDIEKEVLDEIRGVFIKSGTLFNSLNAIMNTNEQFLENI